MNSVLLSSNDMPYPVNELNFSVSVAFTADHFTFIDAAVIMMFSFAVDEFPQCEVATLWAANCYRTSGKNYIIHTF